MNSVITLTPHQSDEEVEEPKLIQDMPINIPLYLHVLPTPQSHVYDKLNSIFTYEQEEPGPSGHIHYHLDLGNLQKEHYLLIIHKFIPDTSTDEHFFVEVVGAWS